MINEYEKNNENKYTLNIIMLHNNITINILFLNKITFINILHLITIKYYILCLCTNFGSCIAPVIRTVFRLLVCTLYAVTKRFLKKVFISCITPVNS